jgi:uroporphyrinogen-III decarboxylase
MVLLEQGSEADLKAELRRQARAGRRNNSRFFFSLGSPVTPPTPVSRVRLYTDLAHEAGRR